MMTARVELQLLGELAVRVHGVDLAQEIGPVKTRLLLGWICTAPREGLPRADLAVSLWPRAGRNHALASLVQSLALLKRLLTHGVHSYLEVESDHVRLRRDRHIRVDVDRFARLVCSRDPDAESLCEAVSLYLGPFLSDLPVPREPELRDALARTRDRYREQALQMALRASRVLESEGALARALELAQRAIEIDPDAESAWRRLVKVRLARSEEALALLDASKYSERMQAQPGGSASAAVHRLLSLCSIADPAEVSDRNQGDGISANGSPATDREASVGGGSWSSRWPVTVVHVDLSDTASQSSDEGSRREMIGVLGDRYRAYPVIGERACSAALLFGYPRASAEALGEALHAARELDDWLPHSGIGVEHGQVTLQSVAATEVGGLAAVVARGLAREARPGEVLVGPRVAGDQFRAFEMTLVEVEPAVGVSSVPGARLSRLGPPRRGLVAHAAIYPLVGREREFRQLRGYARGVEPLGGAMLVEGPRGAGKTRLLTELWNQIDGRTGDWFELRGESGAGNLPFHPFVTAIRQQAAIGEEADWSEVLGRLRIWLRRQMGAKVYVPNADLASLADLFEPTGVPSDNLPRNLSPRERLEHAAKTLLDLFLYRGGVVVVEDVERVDAQTMQWLARLASRLRGQPPRLILTTARKEDIDPKLLASCHLLHLPELTLGQMEDILPWIAEEWGDPGRNVRRCLDLAGGSPLILEQLALANPPGELSTRLTIPPGVHDLLAEHVDAAGDAFALAVVLAQIEGFATLDQLRELADRDEMDAEGVQAHLARLMEMGIVRETVRLGVTRYAFTRELYRVVLLEAHAQHPRQAAARVAG
ncbi:MULTISPECIES: AAA family ATPase [unclassified Thioalkalivibrio]|uniref:AAA family ATPase n=1 Tax=unclassified Thioalkalivibrio TaxID=2621013 RepID=UPI00037F184D|nr:MULTISPECIES: AAA family ATPase [unclassified Thioalkalivibrio]